METWKIQQLGGDNHICVMVFIFTVVFMFSNFWTSTQKSSTDARSGEYIFFYFFCKHRHTVQRNKRKVIFVLMLTPRCCCCCRWKYFYFQGYTRTNRAQRRRRFQPVMSLDEIRKKKKKIQK